MARDRSNKDERQYEHIRQSAKDQGEGERTASEAAARTVEEQRPEEGRTPNSPTSDTDDATSALEHSSRDELYDRAKELQIDGRSRMSREELAEAIRKR